ncbi:MAG: LysR family transcriptional regulator [Eubacteriales bacterium]|nr:LysR family transcriptional regulator [Eubacteriales bacterium]
MTLQQLYYAIMVAEMGSMNKAAEKLYISQPTMTSAIKELEKETQITIFQRTSRGVIPTNEGVDFLMHARQLYQQYELLKDRYSGNKNFKRKFGVSTQHYSFIDKAFVETIKYYDTLDFDFAIRETTTKQVITDVGILKSEIGILFMSDTNRKVLTRMLNENDLVFTPLIDCNAYVYLYKGHPLANEKSISLEQLADYPCLSFEQGSDSSVFFAEELLSDNEYPRSIKATDRATMLNLMVGLNGYTLCSGIICEELNGTDYVAVPFKEDEKNKNITMEIGYISKKHSIMSDIGKRFIHECKVYLGVPDDDFKDDAPSDN